MKNQLKSRAKEDAKFEARLTNESMIQELIPLLKEYFIATLHAAENAIVMNFLSGQQVILTVHVGV